MMALQTNLSYVPATVFLGSDRKSIMFSRYGDKNFIDYTDGNEMAAWTCNSLCIGENEYKYNTWVEIDDVLKNYFRELLRDTLENV